MCVTPESAATRGAVRRQELRLDGVEFAEPIGQTFVQPFPMQLEVSTHDLGLVGREDGADLVRRHPLTREHALGPAGRRAASVSSAQPLIVRCGV